MVAAASLAACVLPSTGASFRDLIVVASPAPKVPGAGLAPGATAPPGTNLVITQTPVPVGPGTPGPAASGGVSGAGRLLLEADLNVGTPTFSVLALGEPATDRRAGRHQTMRAQALPPGFSMARFQLSGSTGQTARIGDLAVDAATGRGTASVQDLPPGSYAILVVALETGGLVAASGTASIVVPAGGVASASLKLESAAKQRVRVDFPSGEIPTPSFSISYGGRQA